VSNENNPSPNSLLEWFRQNHRREFDLQSEIARRAEEIFRDVTTQLPEGQIQPILIGISRRPEVPRLGIVMNEPGMVFVGTMARAILDSLSAEFEGIISSRIANEVIEKKVRDIISLEDPTQGLKKCPHCQSDLRSISKYCDQCGKELEE
jgi:hypothetical protein